MNEEFPKTLEDKAFQIEFENVEKRIEYAKKHDLCAICLTPKDVCLKKVDERKTWYCDG